MSEVTITDSAGGFDGWAGFMVRNETDAENYLIITTTETVLTTRRWNWVMSALIWNPCNKLLELYDYA